MARQKLGQHFLASGKALERIAQAACGERIPLAIEIGPGKGALTEVLHGRAERVVAIELDPALAEFLRTRWPAGSGVEVMEGDALRVDWNAWGEGVLTGNLPYYVASALISKFLRNPGPIPHGVFLIQKEVAERITAKPGTRDYGYLSVECQFLARAEYLFSVPPGAFRPPPKVDSAVVRLTPVQNAAAPADPEAFLRFVGVCFRQKRKTLRNNLSAAYPREVVETMPGIERRSEQLGVGEFIELFESVAARR